MTDAGHCILARYKRTQDRRDLDQAIKHFERASDLCPVDHPYRPATLSNLATAKFVSCQVNGTYLDLDLDIPISLFQDALDMRPTGHPDRPLTQLHLAIALLSRFAKRGYQADADAAKELLNEVRNVSLADSHLSRVALLAIKTSALFCFHTDDPHAVDEVISLHYDALGYYSTANDQRGQLLCNLGVMLATRFERRGNSQDLDEAIAFEREALYLHPIGHTDRSSSLNNLGNQLSIRFEHRGNDQDLDEAIVLSREALALHSVGHTDRSSSLNNLANQLSIRFEHQGNVQDLDEAIVLSREALALRPVGHTDRSSSLYNLASHLSARFQYRGTAQDLNESLENLCCALTLLTQHDPHQSMVHQSLAVVYLLFHRSELHAAGDSSDSMNAVMHHFKAAANLVSGGFLGRLRASLDWVRHADKYAHGTDLEAYATSMQLLDAYMSATASVSSRHHTMKNFPSTLAVDAASCALRRGDVCRAVELLEQGRTLIWTQMARFRTPLDNLQDHGAHAEALMKKFRDLSSILDRPPNHSEGMSRVDIEAEVTRYRCLVKNWNTALDDIRKIKGFDCFLLAPLFSELQGAARNGPIIILIASKSSCNAIIVPHKESPVSVELTITVEKLVQLVNTLQRTVEKDTSPQDLHQEKYT
ncbi:uncharacterized protein EDB91DRAFT_1057825 [Suillus paluster]|uniref:uncharacterized protein n=1 Tax=Suillus paluster TaxID=48578 RepID=UPI001B869BAE|nr:uncharacterized protein EDB91DRAFT_1057825 [Suillus paluster]KAG1732868.1 hypothetical protein EDB91DRAFT_1057825 [Suillus paluster]